MRPPPTPPPAAAAPTVRAAWLVWYRRVIGATVLWQTLVTYGSASWRAIYVDPVTRVAMPGLEMLQLTSTGSLHALFLGTIACAAATLVGVGGRVAPAIMALLLLVEFAQDASLYLNHHYLMILLSMVAAIVPTADPQGRAPANALRLVRFQLTIPYVYAAVAKLDPDWLTGAVMRRMLETREPAFGALVTMPMQAEVMTLASVVLDAIAPLMLWFGPGRPLAWTAMCIFHLANSGLYNIGVFPWLMLLATPILLPDDTPARMASTLRSGSLVQRAFLAVPATCCALIGGLWPANPNVFTVLIAAFAGAVAGHLYGGARMPDAAPTADHAVPSALPAALIAVWMCVQVLVPLRHFVIPGDVTWTEEGHRYAWRMLLRNKRVTDAMIEVTDPATGESWYLGANELLAPHQATDVLGRPDLAVGFAKAISRRWEAAGHPGAEVRLRVHVGLNGRPPTLIYDPAVDLAHVDDAMPAPWILPTPRLRWL